MQHDSIVPGTETPGSKPRLSSAAKRSCQCPVQPDNRPDRIAASPRLRIREGPSMARCFTSRRLLMAALTGAAVLPNLLPLIGRAEARFPNNTMRIMVPCTPGGSNDVFAREIASGLHTNLNQPAAV